MTEGWTEAGGEGHPRSLKSRYAFGGEFVAGKCGVGAAVWRRAGESGFLSFAPRRVGMTRSWVEAKDLQLRRRVIPTIELFESQFALDAVALFAVADFVVEGREKIERDVCRLKVLWIGVSYVVGKGSEG
jgi:hypothetical protein